MKDLQKTRKLVKTSFFIAVVTIAAVLAFPRELTGKEWQIYMNSYLITTMGLTVGGAAIGIFFGMALAFFKFQKTNNEIVNMIKDVVIDEYVDIMRGTPMVLQLLILSVVIAVFDNYWVAVIALGMNSAAYVEETVRSGIESIDKGQMEAARATGMPYRMAMNEIIMPQAVKNILPALVNEFINLFKETSIVGYISVVDITMNSKSLQAVYYSVKPILFTGVVYYVSVKLFSFIGKRLEMRLKEND
ncbi:amino acid ABC transporter permease [Leptotrichia buccalis]|jgi:amino ABC transporter, permease protein, 3-TM region, his/glu/gln/arg/opine family|uniref:Polar amino acid ABC transporter, inner membrane subunit n=1 Tax=Leptotrichia buccalis (strain ATCC 14201 / DSM 1135 / JCM 12969 / NCTC 10249 / C-1013-b) TaxID=523794 RepID=C7N987_LEPBD|nr:amino acid ABC transporter permease [Leptotrichia buccalis]ACV38718.1 polar amino acid ABC transporter, inner membrane subunit [Leptotrichia buccalis C-1013-b]